jgi:hypothetical protein
MKLKYTGLLIVLAGLLMGSCKKQQNVFTDPYADAKAPLGIVSDPQQIPVPASGVAGTTISVTATGLKTYYDKGQLTFLFNGQKAEIVSVSETGIKVKVPASASSGVTSFVVNGQLVFGPLFTVIGKVNLDPTYVNVSGTDFAVRKAFPVPLTTSLILLGDFTNYNNQGLVKRINRITRVFADGTWDRSFQSGAGANSTVYDIAQVGPYYYIVGDFNQYAQQSGNVSKIAKITTSGVIDTMAAETYLHHVVFVPTFNGGFTNTVRSIYPVGTNKMIVSGDFTFYTSRRYNQNSYDAKDSTIVDSIEVRQLARLNDNGRLDKTWRFDSTVVGYKPNKLGKSKPGANGSIKTLLQKDGKIVVYGKFTTFDGQPANNILRLTAQGDIDPTFNVGSGTDQGIDYASYNATLNKYVLIGQFSKFNGKASQYMAVINADGTYDTSFTPKVFDGGVPQFGKMLNDGITIINGGFKSYDGVIRNGFAVTDATGALKDGYNTIGNVSGPGQINDIYETKSADNKRALLIMGNFSSFDNQIKHNIVRVTFE